MEREQMKDVCAELGIECAVLEMPRPADATGWDAEAYHYRATLRFQGRELVTAFKCGAGWADRVWKQHLGDYITIPRKPSAADVLSSLCLDASAGEETFADFCASFGYDTDSRKALETYLACQKAGHDARRFLREHFDRCANAEH